jgi:hypothetical protein
MTHERTFRWTRVAVAALTLWLVTGAPATASQLVEQTIELRPGWNSIWLEVQPQSDGVAALFDGLPLESVWTWNAGLSRVQFIWNPGDGLRDRPGWRGWFPPGPEQFLGNLHALQVNRAYLVNYVGDAPTTITVVGRPSPRPVVWAPDSFNLVGFPVDPDAPPTFETFLSPSAAHAGQPVYRLGAGGQWERMTDPAMETIARGEAYWVYSQGASGFNGPVDIELEQEDGLDYGEDLVERRIRFRNLSGENVGITVRPFPADMPISYWRLESATDPDSGQAYRRVGWPDLGAEHGLEVGTGRTTVLRLAVRRAQFATETMDGILEVADGAGTRRLIPVSARSPHAGSPERPVSDPGLPGGGAQAHTHMQGSAGGGTRSPHAGLWVGSVFVDAVSEPAVDPVNPTPVGQGLGFRLIVHVDAVGDTRLLKQVTQMWEDGSLHPAGGLAEPGRYVLVSDDGQLSHYRGSALRGGEAVGIRISSAAYTFDGASLDMSGTFGVGGSVTALLQLAQEAPTNPFRHAYHPDHDGQDDGVRPPSWESYGIQRSWTLEFALDDPSGTNPPEWGDTLMAGTFAETITGLRNDDVVVGGRFEIRRVSDVALLNE